MNEQLNKHDGVGSESVSKSFWHTLIGWCAAAKSVLIIGIKGLQTKLKTWWPKTGRRLLIRSITRLVVLVLLGFMASAVVNYVYQTYSLRQTKNLDLSYRLGAETVPQVEISDSQSPSDANVTPSGHVELGPKTEMPTDTAQETDVQVQTVGAKPTAAVNPSPSLESVGSGSSREPALGITANPANVGPGGMMWPVDGQVAVGYGWVRHPVYRDWRFHPGVEFTTSLHAPVQAIMEGRVQQIQSERLRGLVVTIAHGDDWQSIYKGLSQLHVQEGQLVQKGQSLGLVGPGDDGQSGRFSFEVRQTNTPLDPRMYLP
ncbi:MAG: M23 family metallopeptidase [Firmicutes bacterium]|nr:M23 family metallopeptidase [Bacillota bacterium]